MASLEAIRESVREQEPSEGEDGVVPADADLSDVCRDERETVEARIEAFPDTQEGVIPALQAIQDEYGFLPSFSMQLVARKCGVSMAHVFGTASFYSQFYLEPRGEHTIKVCTGTACHVQGADEISEGFCDELDVDLEEVTDDGQFTVSHVRCIGACSLAPAVMVGEDVHGNVTDEKIDGVIEEYRGEES